MTEEKIELIRHEDSFWCKFMQKAVELDSRDAPHSGWYWFFGIYYLYYTLPEIPRIMLDLLQTDIPDNHWLKKIHDPDNPKKEDFYAIKNAFATKNCEELFGFIADLTNKHGIPDSIDFSRLHFDSHANFNGFIFPLEVFFDYTTFSNGVFFEKAIFYHYAHFNKTQFSGESDVSASITFNDAIFFGLANFGEANFINGVSFNGVSFLKNAHFQNASFGEIADFTNAKLPEFANFRDAIFSSLANFRNADISGIAIFIGVQFETRAPYLHDAKIGTGILWDTNINLWPQTKKDADNETDDNYNYRIRSNQNNYENLVSHMQKLNKNDDEHFFFRQEMRWRRLDNKLTQNLFKGYFNWKIIEDKPTIFLFSIYEIFADYGYGIGRAFVWWFVHIIFGAVILFAIRSVDRFNMSFDDFGCSVGISLSNSHAFFFKGDRLKDCYKTFEYLPAFNFIWGLQTITGTILIFLVLLTLRVRFRLK